MNKPPTNLTGIERAIKCAGTQSKLAKAIGVTQQVVWHWKKTGIVSDAGKCAEIEQFTKGKPNGDVRCEELNPHENWAVLRDVLCNPDRKPPEPVKRTSRIGGSSSKKVKEARA
jgi:DNA-binding transcriptional regulator YdaS (Cro superfamily)